MQPKNLFVFLLSFSFAPHCFCSESTTKELHRLLQSIDGYGQDFIFKEKSNIDIEKSMCALSDSFETAKELEAELDELLDPPQIICNPNPKHLPKALILNCFFEKQDPSAPTKMIQAVYWPPEQNKASKKFFSTGPNKKTVLRIIFSGKHPDPTKPLFYFVKAEHIKKFENVEKREPSAQDESIGKKMEKTAQHLWKKFYAAEKKRKEKSKKKEHEPWQKERTEGLFCNKPSEELEEEIDGEWEVLT